MNRVIARAGIRLTNGWRRTYRIALTTSPGPDHATIVVTARLLDPLPLAPGMVAWPARSRRRRRTR